MGKSATGAVWLNEDNFSPYDFWQYWRNTEDADVGRFLKIFTRLPLDEIARLAALGGSEINEAKKVLATEATAIVHGRDAAEQAAETARKTFEEGTTADTLPTVTVDRALLASGVGILSLFVTAGLASSNGEARRHVQGGAVRVNDQPVSDDRRVVTDADMTADGAIKLSLGKKKHVLVRPTELILLERLERSGLHRNSKIDRKIPGAITDSGLICTAGESASPSSLKVTPIRPPSRPLPSSTPMIGSSPKIRLRP